MWMKGCFSTIPLMYTIYHCTLYFTCLFRFFLHLHRNNYPIIILSVLFFVSDLAAPCFLSWCGTAQVVSIVHHQREVLIIVNRHADGVVVL